MASNLPDPSQIVSVLESAPSGSTPDSGDTAVVSVPNTDESGDEVNEGALARPRKETNKNKSLCERFSLQRVERNEHYRLFRTEYRMLISFLMIPIISGGAGLFLQAAYSSTMFSRLFLNVGAILYFGIFVAYWKGIPAGPPFLSELDGSPALPRYLKMKLLTSYSQKIAAPIGPIPRPGPLEPQPGPSTSTQLQAQPGPSWEPQPGPSRPIEEPQPGSSREP